MPRRTGRNFGKSEPRLNLRFDQLREKPLSPNEIGSMLGITGEAVKQWIYHRHLPAVKLSNGYWKVQADDLKRFIESREHPKAKVLIVGVTATDHEIIKRSVTELGADVIVATNIMDGVLKTKCEQPNLIVADTDMTGMWEFVRKVRNGIAKAASIMILASGSSAFKNVDEALELGVSGCIQKPLDGTVLEREFKNHLGLR